MPIEFHCDQCQRRLQVPDDSVGKQAQCPNCSAVLRVPGEPHRGPAFDTTVGLGPNPYAAPPTAGPQMSPRVGGLSHEKLDPGFALATTWYFFKRSAFVLIGAYLILMGASFGLSFGGSILQGVIGVIQGDPNDPLVVLFSLGLSLLNTVVQSWLTIGIIRICCAVVRRQPADVGMVFSGGPWLLRYLGASILFGMAATIGFVLFIVPGVYLVLTYWSYVYFLIDRNCGVMDAFQQAGSYGAGNRFSTFVLGLLGIGLMLVGVLACGIGVLVTAPLVVLLFSVAYLMISGQYDVPDAQPVA